MERTRDELEEEIKVLRSRITVLMRELLALVDARRLHIGKLQGAERRALEIHRTLHEQMLDEERRRR